MLGLRDQLWQLVKVGAVSIGSRGQGMYDPQLLPLQVSTLQVPESFVLTAPPRSLPMQDLWSPLREQRRAHAAPLAMRMRPRALAEFVGQAHCLGEGKLLRKLIDADALSSVILSGPPGTGKTTFAEIVANQTKAAFERAHGARTGVKELREMIDAATRRLGENSRRTMLFVDEIHRLARNQAQRRRIPTGLAARHCSHEASRSASNRCWSAICSNFSNARLCILRDCASLACN